MKSDIEIAQSVTPKPIPEIAGRLGLTPEQIEPYGRDKAKLPLTLLGADLPRKKGRLILVSAINPTPAGEGKTTTSIGLTQALNRIGQNAVAVLREPSLGPVFGMKGGATGGGLAQIIPMEDVNLHFTGDFAAIEKANNLLAALIDNDLQRKASLGLDPRSIRWKRVMDMNDRALRQMVSGLGGKSGGVPRETGFDITAASEVMAILCLAQSFEDLKDRLGRIYIGNKHNGTPVFARDLKAVGAMAALLKDAVKPNLVQTLEGNPAILHGGPFANIAQGTNSLIATKMGLKLADYTVTEAGFGFDLGGEKFLHIKCAAGGLVPDAVVIVATIRALKYHGGVGLKDLGRENAAAVRDGADNLLKHLENASAFGLRPVVAINRFAQDTADEISALEQFCRAANYPVALINVWAEGGAGAENLARMLVEQIEAQPAPKLTPLYDAAAPFEEKMRDLAQKVYGAKDIVLQGKARKDLAVIRKLGLEHLPLCTAKTQKSLSDNEALRGRPKDFTLTIREIEIAAGAGFLIPITGEMLRMPGLPAQPAAEGIDIDAAGKISGLA